jgi:tRNA A37 N6-isopentenylltransferase MiaA
MSYLAVVGPTCSGKTASVKKVAGPNHERINLDSFQMYDFFRLGTGRSEGSAGHLYGILDPHEEVTAELYLDKVEQVLGSIATRDAQPVFEGGSLTLLRALASQYTLRIVGVRPSQSADLNLLIERRIATVGQENLIEETRQWLQRGYRDTTVMRDDVVYLPLVQHLDGESTKKEAFERIHTNLADMHERQMGAYQAMPGLEWVES